MRDINWNTLRLATSFCAFGFLLSGFIVWLLGKEALGWLLLIALGAAAVILMIASTLIERRWNPKSGEIKVVQDTMGPSEGTSSPEGRFTSGDGTQSEAHHSPIPRTTTGFRNRLPVFLDEARLVGSRQAPLAAGEVGTTRLHAWGASRQGNGHMRVGCPREDAFAMRSLDWGIVAVVTDGVGSTRRAGACAATVAETCAAYPWVNPVAEGEWAAQVGEVLVCVNAAVHAGEPDAEQVFGRDRGSSTLLVCLVVPEGPTERVFWASVGDSAICRLNRSKGRNPEFVNTAPFSSGGMTDAVPVEVVNYEMGDFTADLSSEFLLLLSDGCALPLRQDPESYRKYFNGIVEQRSDPSHMLAAIRHSGAGFDDDITAVLVARPGAAHGSY